MAQARGGTGSQTTDAGEGPPGARRSAGSVAGEVLLVPLTVAEQALDGLPASVFYLGGAALAAAGVVERPVVAVVAGGTWPASAPAEPAHPVGKARGRLMAGTRSRRVAQRASPARERYFRRDDPYQTSGGAAAIEVFPYVMTTYRAGRAPHRRRCEPLGSLPRRASAGDAL